MVKSVDKSEQKKEAEQAMLTRRRNIARLEAQEHIRKWSMMAGDIKALRTVESGAAKKLGDVIRGAIKSKYGARGQTQFAKYIGVDQPNISILMAGKIGYSEFYPLVEWGLEFRPGELLKLLFGFSKKSLDETIIEPSIIIESGPAKVSTMEPVDNSGAPLKSSSEHNFSRYYLQPVATDSTVGYIVSTIEHVDQPPKLKAPKEAFEICVYGDENSERYESGDIVTVDPFRQPLLGDEVVLRPTSTNDQRVIMGQLDADTDTEWHIRQHKMGNIIKLKKSEWGRIAIIAHIWIGGRG